MRDFLRRKEDLPAFRRSFCDEIVKLCFLKELSLNNCEKAYIIDASIIEEGSRVDNDVFLGDVIQTRKPHPCGGDTWVVIRTGADIKIKCQGCGRIVMLDREVFFKRRKKLLQRTAAPEAEREEQT